MGAIRADDLKIDTRPSELRPRPTQATIFQGSLRDINVVGLLQSLEVNQTTASVTVKGLRRRGRVWLREGQICHAVFGSAAGAEAVYRMLCLDDGTFCVEFGDARGEGSTIAGSNAGLLMEGVRRRDHLVHILSKLPDPSSYLEWKYASADAAIPQLAILSKCNGTKTLEQLLDGAPDALEAAEQIHEAWKLGDLKIVGVDSSVRPFKPISTDADVVRPAEPDPPPPVIEHPRANVNGEDDSGEAENREDDPGISQVPKKKRLYFRAVLFGLIMGTASSFAMVSWKPDWALMLPTANALGPLCGPKTVAVDGLCVDVHPATSDAYSSCVDEQRCDPHDASPSSARADQYCAFIGGQPATQAQWDQAATRHGLSPSPVGLRCARTPQRTTSRLSWLGQ